MAKVGGALKASVLVKRCRYKGQTLHDSTRVRSPEQSDPWTESRRWGQGLGWGTECSMGQCPFGKVTEFCGWMRVTAAPRRDCA